MLKEMRILFTETLEKLSKASSAKRNLLDESMGKYFVASLLAGLYVGLGIFLIMTVGGLTKGMGPHFKIFIGLAFGVALSLVVMAGSELFTGNNLIMAAGAANKEVSWGDAGKVWGLSYFGNLAGSIIAGALFVYSGAAASGSPVAEFIVNLSKAKMGGAPVSLIFKGILCNLLVCLAVLCCIKMKEEGAKLIMIFWCLFAFITSGYEHSIANMSIFTAGLMYPAVAGVSFGGAVSNLLWVTLGNFIGGSVLGLAYYYMGKKNN